jgi:hypothetical protein
VKIGCYHQENIFCSWNFSKGIAETFRRLGHEVVDNVMDNSCDFYFVTGPEHLTVRPTKKETHRPIVY